MRLNFVSSMRENHHLEHYRALKEGLSHYGIECKLSSGPSKGDKFVACWGWRKGKMLRDQGYEVLVLERGYIGDRFKYTSIAWNGLNGHATFPDRPCDGGERFKSHGGIMQPWSYEGGYVLIMGQVPGDASLNGQDMVPWYEDITAMIQVVYPGLPVHFRPHPDCIKKGLRQSVAGTVQSSGTLQEAIAGALFTVCWNSNSAVDSILAGKPCYAGDQGTMAYELCSKNIAQLESESRHAWAYDLAWKQWSIDEIQSGMALASVAETIKCGR